MKRKRIIIFLILISCYVFSGCSQEKTSKPFQVTDSEKIFQITNDNELIVYNLFVDMLGRYNTLTGDWTAFIDQPNVYQYSFLQDTSIFTTGHSKNNEFEILKNNNNKIKSIFKFNNSRDCIFPLAKSNDQYYFLQYIDEGDDTKITQRNIVTLDENGLNTILSTNQLISYGVIINDLFYYSVYIPDKDVYDVYSFNLLSKKAEPCLIKENLISGQLYCYDGELYFSNLKEIYNNHESFNKKYYNDFLDKYDLLLQLDTNKYNNIEFTLLDLNTKEQVYNSSNVINYEINSNELLLYTTNGTKNIDLYSLKNN